MAQKHRRQLADVTQNYQSFKHLSLLQFLKFLLYLMLLVHQYLNLEVGIIFFEQCRPIKLETGNKIVEYA